MGALVVLALALCCFSGVFSDLGEKIDCSRLRATDTGLIVCNRMYRPVCGTDDTTYPSECDLCRQNLEFGRNVDKKHDGKCLQISNQGYCSDHPAETNFCPMNYQAHCGSDGTTYSNKCDFCNAVARSGGTILLQRMGVC